jgi:hypothetical protein
VMIRLNNLTLTVPAKKQRDLRQAGENYKLLGQPLSLGGEGQHNSDLFCNKPQQKCRNGRKEQ